MIQDRQFEIQTPIGSVSSDSGNHLVDVLSVSGVIICLYIIKKVMEKYYG
jgi:hypothetical protein